MSVVLENDFIKVVIYPQGAELVNLYNKITGIEHMWSRDASVWGKSSPVLFPIVGTLKDDTYHYQNHQYKLSRHGFARDYAFEIEKSESQQAVFLLRSNENTKKNYPFDFEFRLHYQLVRDVLRVNYIVKNTGNAPMLFSVGGHPAFAVPFVENTDYQDYFLKFDTIENAPRWPITSAGLIDQHAESFMDNADTINMTKELFYQDAIVLKNLKSETVSLRSSKHHHGLDFSFEGFPFMGIWAAKNGNFVCIEPWCGVADSSIHNQQLEQKEGIENLHAGDTWSRAWKVKVF